MNGVIVDDEAVHEHAFEKVLKKYKIDLDHRTYLKLFTGRTDRNCFEKAEEYYGIRLPIDSLLIEKRLAYFKLFSEDKKIFSGISDLIKRLSGKFTLALTSSASREEIDLITKEFNIRKYFTEIVSADDVKKGKPHPEPYLLISKKLNIEPRYCVVIEDAVIGIQSAKAAGMHCIAITNTHTKKDLKDADVIVGGLEEITCDLILNIAGTNS